MDLISRQAAIDALGEKPLAWEQGEYEEGLQTQWESDVEAIKALPSAQPTFDARDTQYNLPVGTDLISRQAAIDAINRAVTKEAARWSVEELPSAQPEQQWIPCSERLPEDGATVWVTIKGHDVIRCEDGETLEQAIERINKIRWVTQGYWSEEEHGWNDPSYGCPLIAQPIAWMPIDTPEPYKEGQG